MQGRAADTGSRQSDPQVTIAPALIVLRGAPREEEGLSELELPPEAAGVVEAEAAAPSATPHKEKLLTLLKNDKLPAGDKPRIEEALRRYESWIVAMKKLNSAGDQRVAELTELLNEYKRYLELDVIFDSDEDFLYRQSGQLKLSASVLEEFLPHLAVPSVIEGLKGKTYDAGPRRAFAGASFAAPLTTEDTGLLPRTKAQDFTLGRLAHLKAAFDAAFTVGVTSTEVHLALAAAEIKTNLDKTMFQEAIATAHDLRAAVRGARYYLLCEWLDMTPLPTAGTDIEQVIILRGRRLAADERRAFAAAKARKEVREAYAKRLVEKPIRLDALQHFVNLLRGIFTATAPVEEEVLKRGYF